MTRRKAIGKIAATIAVAAVVPSTLAQSSNNKTRNMKTPNLTDPRTKYPKPPFKSQSQPFPGLTGKMTPIPDHGEKAMWDQEDYQGEKH